MFCGNCGREISDQAKFCPGCGQPVKQEPVTEPVMQEPVTPQDQAPTYPGPDSYGADPYQAPGVGEEGSPYSEPDPGYTDPGDGYRMPNGYVPPSDGYIPPSGYPNQPDNGYGAPGGYPPQNNGGYGAPGGYPPQNNGGYGTPGGYAPQNNGGYGAPGGYPPQNNGGYTPGPAPVKPGKKGSKGVIIGIVAGAVVLVAAVVTILVMALSGNDSSSSSSSGTPVLPSSQSESSTPSSQPSEESSDTPSESSETPSSSPSSPSSQPQGDPSDVPQDSNAETIFQSFIGFPCDYTSTKDDVQSALENVGYTCSWETDDHLTGTVSDGRNLNGYEVVQVDAYFRNGYFIGGELIFINYGDGDESALLDSIRGQFQSIQTAGYGYSLDEESDEDGVYFTDNNGVSAWGAAVFHETDTDYGYLYCQFGEINWCNSNY
ncbi:MAG TPA: zinc-ribbon domain-containing protein [Firmicutes bacterium]|nr:zinc-ribbon domain-containing protein [Bacillota bacterium]